MNDNERQVADMVAGGGSGVVQMPPTLAVNLADKVADLGLKLSFMKDRHAEMEWMYRDKVEAVHLAEGRIRTLEEDRDTLRTELERVRTLLTAEELGRRQDVATWQEKHREMWKARDAAGRETVKKVEELNKVKDQLSAAYADRDRLREENDALKERIEKATTGGDPN